MRPTFKKHKTAILASASTFFLGMLFLFAGLRLFPALSAKLLPDSGSVAARYESKQPGKGMAWLQPAPPPVPQQAPQAQADEDDEAEAQAAREEMIDAEKQMQAMRRQFFGGQDPFAQMRKMHEDMEKDLRRGGGSLFSMTFDGGESQKIVEKEDDHAIYYEISGIDQTKLQTHVDGGMLTISGQTKQEKGKGGFHAMVQQSFQRSFSLPPNVDPNGMQLSSEKDKVVLKFPKKG